MTRALSGNTEHMKKPIALTIAAAGMLSLVACSSGDEGGGTPDYDAGGVATSASSAVDNAKLMAFVVAFRTGYSDLAENRSDEDIEEIVTESCAHLAAGADKQTVTVDIETLAANDGTKPTPEQSENIYNLVAPSCP